MRPRIASTRLVTRIASMKSPVTCVSAARKRLPKLWPTRPCPAWKRYWNKRPISASSLESATMQLRMSPGGKMRFSRRNRPELPPSSVTVTMAARSEMGRSAVASSSGRRTTCSFKPRNKVESPVPPPKATMRKPVGSAFLVERCFFICLRNKRHVYSTEKGSTRRKPQNASDKWKWRHESPVTSHWLRFLADKPVFLGVKQLGEARIFLKKREVFVVARVVAVFRAQLDGDFEVFECRVGLAREAIERG